MNTEEMKYFVKHEAAISALLSEINIHSSDSDPEGAGVLSAGLKEPLLKRLRICPVLHRTPFGTELVRKMDAKIQIHSDASTSRAGFVRIAYDEYQPKNPANVKPFMPSYLTSRQADIMWNSLKGYRDVLLKSDVLISSVRAHPLGLAKDYNLPVDPPGASGATDASTSGAPMHSIAFANAYRLEMNRSRPKQENQLSTTVSNLQ